MDQHVSGAGSATLEERPETGGRAALRALLSGQRLSPAQRRIAHHLLEHPEDVAFLSSSEVAERIGVSQPSMTRFAVALGFTGYPELRDRARSLVLEPLAVADPTGSGNGYQRLVTQEIQNLVQLREDLAEPGAINGLGRHLADSLPLCVLGLRVSAPLAQLLGYYVAKVHPDVRVLTEGGSLLEDHLAQAASAGATWVLAIALPRPPRELATALDRAGELGLRVALLADEPVDPLADRAEQVVCTRVADELVFDSHAAPAVLATVLAQAVFDALPPPRQARIEALETAAAERQVFLGE